MKSNEIMPAALENKMEAKVSPIETIDMCKMQFYNPMPIVGAKLTFAYVPFQCLCCLYPPEVGLRQGTIFPELDRPYGADPVYTIDG